ncbi:DUF1349 domain-containing protein [Streptomyces hoynatensis]|uniref:DUF1349 domain-containing protein n=1 Tax=Streptomyces hoynatensis TaxID=1141874 RepID=UPI001F4EBC7C|nr:DUF1349 domain-containing protein [Streptomyces hoynatensis]
MRVPAIPTPLRWLNTPVAWAAEGADALTISAGAGTDWFLDPGTPGRFANAPALIGPLAEAGAGAPGGGAAGQRGAGDGTAAGDFVLTARVTAPLEATYDAGALVVYAGETSWAKLCLELSPQGRPTLVSVVTRGVSDDANAFPVPGGDVLLRLARVGSAYAFHASLDGRFWHLIRYFALDAAGRAEAGFLAQSPTGQGLTVGFRDLAFARRTLRDLRDGS